MLDNQDVPAATYSVHFYSVCITLVRIHSPSYCECPQRTFQHNESTHLNFFSPSFIMFYFALSNLNVLSVRISNLVFYFLSFTS